jgi:predicted CoA-substrate-specific enzyme activase
MIVAGCDLGTITAKAIIMKDGEIVSHEIMPYKNLPRQIAEEVYYKALSRTSLSPDQIDFCVATGFGKKAVSYADGESSEVVCLNRAFRFLHPDVRTIIDAGGQSMRAVNINQRGKVLDSTVNEKCAAGTGKFIEVMAKALELPLEVIGELPFSAKEPVSITSQCGVFAESEVITYVNDGREGPDIVAGIARSVANKIASLVRRISLDEKFAMVGGVAKNKGVLRYVEEELGIKFIDVEMDPQLFGALGAALVAGEKHGAN